MRTAWESSLYSRQAPILGESGQEKLSSACVFIAGAGGLGTAVCAYLAAAGVGAIIIADPDRVDISNLNRQIYYRPCDVGEAKAVLLQERILLLNPHIRAQGMVARLEDANAGELAGNASLLIDALDNFPARYVLNRLALRRNIPLIHGAVRGFYGQVTTIIPYRSPCLSCIWHAAPSGLAIPILGATCGVIGSVQGTEAIKYLTGKGSILVDRLFAWDGLQGEAEILQLKRDPACPDCGSGCCESHSENIR